MKQIRAQTSAGDVPSTLYMLGTWHSAAVGLYSGLSKRYCAAKIDFFVANDIQLVTFT